MLSISMLKVSLSSLHFSYGLRIAAAFKRQIGTVIVTGANSGIGKATAMELARHGQRVILACRDVNAGEKAVADIGREVGNAPNQATCRRLDLSSFASICQFVDEINKSSIQIDVLINNAGILPPRYCQTTADGYEITFQTNFLGHFLLTNLLLDNLRKSPNGGRVINAVADPRAFYLLWPPYGFHFYDPTASYDQLQAYIKSKLAITLATTKALHSHLVKQKVNVATFSVDPGVMDPRKGRNTSPAFKTLLSIMPKFLFKTFEQGAETAVYCATQPGLERHSGKFFQNCKVINPGARANDEVMAERLWGLSQDLIKPFLQPATTEKN